MKYNKLYSGLLATSMLLAACDSDQVPPDATLSISPDSRSYRIQERHDENGNCVFDPERYIDMPFVLHLSAANGSPINDADISVHLDLAANVFSGLSVVSLYEDRNGNGIVDADSELVSAADDDLAVVRTDSTTGSYALLVRANVSCSYRSELFAYTGAQFAAASIEVSDDGDMAVRGDQP